MTRILQCSRRPECEACWRRKEETGEELACDSVRRQAKTAVRGQVEVMRRAVREGGGAEGGEGGGHVSFNSPHKKIETVYRYTMT